MPVLLQPAGAGARGRRTRHRHLAARPGRGGGLGRAAGPLLRRRAAGAPGPAGPGRACGRDGAVQQPHHLGRADDRGEPGDAGGRGARPRAAQLPGRSAGSRGSVRGPSRRPREEARDRGAGAGRRLAADAELRGPPAERRAPPADGGPGRGRWAPGGSRSRTRNTMAGGCATARRCCRRGPNWTRRPRWWSPHVPGCAARW